MAVPQRLPIVDSDDGEWGEILNQFIEKEHYNTGADSTVNGGHQKITIRPGTATAGTAPLKFTSGTLLTSAEAGAMEFNSDTLYFTITTGAARRTVAMYDDSSGATGDMYYRNSSGALTRLPVGSTGDVLKVGSGLPAWSANVATPGGTTGQVQYNNAGVLAGAAGFTYQAGASPHLLMTSQGVNYITLILKGIASQSADLQQWQSSSTVLGRITAAGDIMFDKADGLIGASPSTSGYDLDVFAGENTGTGSGGNLDIYAGTSTSGNGGMVWVTGGGSNSGNAGSANLEGGQSTDGSSGDARVKGGSSFGSGQGGSVRLDGGYSQDTQAGDIYISAGDTDSTTGHVGAGTYIKGGDSTSGIGGEATMTGGTSADSDGGGVTVAGGSATTGDGGGVEIQGGISVSGTGGAARLYGGESGDNDGGDARVRGGSSTSGYGGSATVRGGDSAGSNDAGDVSIEGGYNSSDGDGGYIDIYAGSSSSGSGGSVSIMSGSSSSGVAGADITITAGYSDDASGGSTIIQGGQSASSAYGGLVTLAGGNGTTGGDVTINPGSGSNIGVVGVAKSGWGGNILLGNYGWSTTINERVVLGTGSNSLEFRDGSANILSGFGTSGQPFIGRASALTGNQTFYSASGSGSIKLQPDNPGSTNYTLTLPATNGTLLTTGTAYTNGGNNFSGDGTLGLTTNNTLSVITNGTARLTVLGDGNVGIGEPNPSAKLHTAGGSVLSTGTFDGGNGITVTGSGTRMFFDTNKAAFRVGTVYGSEWDDVNVGYNSTAVGASTTASGNDSIAMGSGTTASGWANIAMGSGTTASADSSTAMGSDTNASGSSSTAMGASTTASGWASTAMGITTVASGSSSTAMGSTTTAQAYASLVIGRYNVIAGTTGSWVATDPLFVLGNGASSGSPANALTVLKNGNTTINGTLSVSGGITSPTNINTQTGTTYTLVLADASKVVERNNVAANTITIPLNSSVAFPIGTTIDITQLGAGATTVAATAGVTIRSLSGLLKLAGQYAGATLYKRGTDEWVLVGALI